MTARGVLPRSVVGLVGFATAGAVATALAVAPLPAPGPVYWWALPVFGALLFAASTFVVSFRYGESIDAVNLMEAALAPLLLAFPPLAVVLVMAASQVVSGMKHRLPAIKTLFNTAMWSIAAGGGAYVVARLDPQVTWPDRVAVLVLALMVVGLLNSVLLGAVLVLAEAGSIQGKATAASIRALLLRAVPLLKLGWVAGWAVNVAVGIIFALSYLTAPVSVLLFGVPLAVLYLAYRSYSAARADQERLAAAHRAVNLLAEPLRPLDAVEDFLGALADCFHAAAAELVLRTEGGRQIYLVRGDGEERVFSVRSEGDDIASLEGLLAASPGPVQSAARAGDPVGVALFERGFADCLAAPLRDGQRVVGAVAVLNRGGFEGSPRGEVSIFEALARETTRAIAKGRLLGDVLEERRKLAEIVSRASDGICTLARDGRVLTWNPALEQITGLSAEVVIGRPGVSQRLRARTIWDEPVDLAALPIEYLPHELRLTAADGTDRHLTCSYSRGTPDAEGAALVLVARDVTPVDEHEALREQFTRLVEADAARRAIVDQLQQTVVPGPVRVPGAEIAAAYEPSDPHAPTGGDLYDWQVMPNGDLHVAVVDVLGHGVAATKDALAVVHTLRVLTASGTPLERVVARADELLKAQHPDLVATVMVARYEPSTGKVRVVSGGHPPGLIITPRREVRQLAASGGVIGWPGAGSDDLAEAMLEPGDALVLYTDGLVEARKNILDGMEDLKRHAAEVAQLPAPQFAKELVNRALAGAERRDDTLALVLRRDPVEAGEPTARWEVAPEPAAVGPARRALRDWLRKRDVDGEDPSVVASELLSNAVRVARERIVLCVQLEARGVVIDVSDDGAGDAVLDARGHELPDDGVVTGRGLFLVRALSERVDVLSTTEGSTIRAVLPLRSMSPKPSASDSPRTWHA